LQGTVRAELLARLEFFPLQPRVIVDLGCGTGWAARSLRSRYRGAQVLAVDIAPDMLRAVRRRVWPWQSVTRVCADARALPLASQSVDLIYSNLMLQWCDDPVAVFTELRRALRPGGLLLFSTFGPETLQELREAWRIVDGAPHVSAFANMPQLGSALMSAGLSEPVMDRDLQTHYYPNVASLMAALRSIGATNAAADRRRTLTGRGRLTRMVEAYERGRAPAGLPVSWELIYGAAFAPAAAAHYTDLSGQDRRGEIHVPVSAIRPARR